MAEPFKRAGRKPDPDALYPEHEKLRALEGANNTVGDFIEWLHSEGIVLARYGYPIERQVYVSIKDMGRSERRQLAEVIESRDMEAIVEWLEEHGYEDEIEVGTPEGWGIDSWGYRIALPDPEHPSEPWYYVTLDRERLFEAMTRTEKLLADFFGIDLQRLSDEKEAMLDAQRELNRRTA